MLARLSMSSSRFLDLRFVPSEDDDTLLVDVDMLRRIVRPLPDIGWRHVAGMCGRTITPVYRSLQAIFSDDAEHVARLLSELDPPSWDDFFDDDNFGRARMPPPLSMTSNQQSNGTSNDSHETMLSHENNKRHRRRSSSSRHTTHTAHTPTDYPLIIPSTHTSIPTIVITPCSPQPHPPSEGASGSRPPIQDSCFGNRLTLPKSYPIFNDVFPPLVPTPYPPLPVVEKWRWVDGHWKAVLPTLDEQRKQGLFSRPVVMRRRAHLCRPSRGGGHCDTSTRAW